MLKKILITGGQGMFGQYLMAELTSKAICLDRSALNIKNEEDVEKRLSKGDIDWIINCAGTARGSLENQLQLNAVAAGAMAKASARYDVGMVFISTARIFGRGEGPFTEDSSPSPYDDYGLSKYVGEQLVTRELAAGRFRIIRVSMALGNNQRTPQAQLISRLLHKVQCGETVRVASDVRTSVVHSTCVARMVKACLQPSVANGIYHIASEDHISLYGLAEYIFTNLGVMGQLQPATAAEFCDNGIMSPVIQGLVSTKLPACGTCNQAADLYINDVRRA